MALTNSSFVIDQNYNLWAWGRNNYGQLGNGMKANKLSPIKIMDDVIQVSAGGGHTLAIKSDNSLWAWGYNNYGQLGDGMTANKLSPIKIMDDVIQVSAGQHYTLAIKSDNSLWAWGRNTYGRLGDGTVTTRYRPIKIMDDVIQVTAGGNHTLAIKSDNSLWAWGENYDGQLGDGTTKKYKLSPIKIMDDVIQVSAGYYHTLAIKSDNSLWAWGRNYSGQLGDGTTESRNYPIKIMDDVIQVSSGEEHTLAIKSDNSLWAWGYNNSGQLGDGTTEDKLSPIKIMDDVIQVSAGYSYTLAIKTDGSLWVWGYNKNGELGDGTTTDRHSPVKLDFKNLKLLMNIPPLKILVTYIIKIQEKYKIFKQDEGWKIIGETISEDDFKEFGMDDLSVIPPSAWNELSGEFSILQYREESPEKKESITFNIEPVHPIMLLDDPKLLVYTDNTRKKSSTMELEAVPHGQLVFQYGDFNISAGVESIHIKSDLNEAFSLHSDPKYRDGNTEGFVRVNELELIQKEEERSNDGVIKLIVSPDQGNTWYTFIDESWQAIEPTKEMVKEKGIDPRVLNSLTEEQLDSLLENSPTLRFAYYLEQDNINVQGYLKNISIKTKPVASQTPVLEGININYDELTIEGRLKDLEQQNAVNFAKLQFKTNALMKAEKYKLFNLVVDTFEEDSMVTVESSEYDESAKLYRGIGIVETEMEVLPDMRKHLLISAEYDNCIFQFSLDNGATWHDAETDKLINISEIEGNELIIRVHLPKESSELRALSYMWA